MQIEPCRFWLADSNADTIEPTSIRLSRCPPLYGTGINNEACVLDVATELDIVQKSGSWYSYNGEKIGQGKDNVRLFFQNNPEQFEEVKNLVSEKLKNR